MKNENNKAWLDNFYLNYNLLQHWTTGSSRLGVLVAYQHKSHRQENSDPKTVFVGSCVLHPKDCLEKLGIKLNIKEEVNAGTFSLSPTVRKNLYHSESQLMLIKAINNAKGQKVKGSYRPNNNRFDNYWLNTDLTQFHPLKHEFDEFLGRTAQYFKINGFWTPRFDEILRAKFNTKSLFNY